LAARPVSTGPFLGSKRSERQQPAATLLVKRLPKQSNNVDTKRLRSGSAASRRDVVEETRRVEARMAFFSQASAESKSRCWARLRMARKRVRVARTWVLESDREFEWDAMLVTKRLSMGRDCGTTAAWHEGVARIVARMWKTQA
jgi:hypothetical protein